MLTEHLYTVLWALGNIENGYYIWSKQSFWLGINASFHINVSFINYTCSPRIGMSYWGGYLSKDFKAYRAIQTRNYILRLQLRRRNCPGDNLLQIVRPTTPVTWIQGKGKEVGIGGEYKLGMFSNFTELQNIQRYPCSWPWNSELRHDPCVCPLRCHQPNIFAQYQC